MFIGPVYNLETNTQNTKSIQVNADLTINYENVLVVIITIKHNNSSIEFYHWYLSTCLLMRQHTKHEQI